MNLATSVAVVTGGSSGLGLAVTHLLKEQGVIVEAPPREELDVRNREEVERFIAKVVQQHGRIDVLINNAGWTGPLALLEEVTEEDFDRCMDTNVKGVFHLLSAVLPIMKRQQGGMILTIASRAGSRAHPTLAVYSASKFAVRGLTQAVAKECTNADLPIQCISISPGGIDTPMRASLFGEEDSRRQQSPEAVAAIILAYLRGETDFPHGSDVQIVGGKIVRIVPLDG